MEELRKTLSNLDASSPSVHQAASAMMKHYDQSMIAVNEWRNALQMARGEQLLALLYVANEVLQNSKRNRGPNFLESMSPVLSQALQHICQRDVALTEKVRRVVKIWGDRQILSIRFVNELLGALEQYRKEAIMASKTLLPATSNNTRIGTATPRSTTNPQSQQIKKEDVATQQSNQREMESNNDIISLLDESDQNDSSSEVADDDDEDVFADNPESQKLNLDLNLDSLAATPSNNASQAPQAANKRRRRSTGSGASAGVEDGKRRPSQRRKSNLITDSVATWNRLIQLQQSYYHAQLVLEKIDTNLLKTTHQVLANLVGDELQQAFRENMRFQQQVVEQRRLLHDIAVERHAIEQDCRRYLPWLEQAIKQDDDDLQFCDNLLAKIASFLKVHPTIQRAKRQRLEEERLHRLQREELEADRKRQEEEKRFREAALAKETEAKPGMVWNPSTREYQALNTDESWRD